MTSYHNGRNSVDDIFFELLKVMPENSIPLYLQLDSDFLSRLVQQHPTATLKELCEAVLTKRGVHISPQTMCKMLMRIGLTRIVRCQLQTKSASPQQPVHIAA